MCGFCQEGTNSGDGGSRGEGGQGQDAEQSGGRVAQGASDEENSPSLQLLDKAERDLCSELRVQPKAYLVIKDAIIREAMKAEGKLKKKQFREIGGVDPTKGGRIFEFLNGRGWIENAAKS